LRAQFQKKREKRFAQKGKRGKRPGPREKVRVLPFTSHEKAQRKNHPDKKRKKKRKGKATSGK